MTSNLGAAEMSSLMPPRLGFRLREADSASDQVKLAARLSRTGVAAARHKFSPEFLNRLDKIVVFKALTTEELRRVLDIEIEAVHQRIEAASQGKPFPLDVAESARDFLLREGTDLSYGAPSAQARHRALPRAPGLQSDRHRTGPPRRPHPGHGGREFRYPDVRARDGSAFLGGCPSRSVAGTASGYTARAAPAQKRSRRTRFSTLPEPLFGSSVSENSI
jgi:hypothetical protein